MLKNKRILLGVTGGIAIYKSLDLVSRLKKLGCHVDVIMTEHATEFVTPLCFETMARSRVHVDGFSRDNPEGVEHIDLAQNADLFIIAPATANIMAKAAHGIADDLLSTALLATDAPVIYAPAMNTKMLKNPATQENMRILEKRGAHFIAPGAGFLACNVIGEGRMAEPSEIVQHLATFTTQKDLQGINILVTAGGTREAVDPVRFITNRSSGKTGHTIAKRAMQRGAEVTLITAAKGMQKIHGITEISVDSTKEMLEAVEKYFGTTDALIMSAAPSDFRMEEVSSQKIKKQGDQVIWTLVKNPDILKTVTEQKEHQFVVAFAAETENLLENAREKRTVKRADLMVANDVTQQGAGFEGDTNIVTFIDEKEEEAMPLQSKVLVADQILSRVKRGVQEKRSLR